MIKYYKFLHSQIIESMKRIAIVILVFIPVLVFSQQWKKTRREVLVGAGAANLLGDLGGADQVGTHFMKDLEISLTRPTAGGGFRYKFSPVLAAKAVGSWCRLAGNDALTLEPARNNRNISFRTNVVSFSTQFEYSITEEKSKSRRYARRGKRFPFNLYLFAGVGGFYFNPKAQYLDGTWYELKPLGTEGQGLPGSEAKSYSLYQICLPMGFGLKYPITKEWSIGLEYSVVKTFTDYLDDVSTVYYDNNAIKSARGDVAAFFADPSTSPTRSSSIVGATNPGELRGETSYNDAYLYAWIYVSYKISKSGVSRVKF